MNNTYQNKLTDCLEDDKLCRFEEILMSFKSLINLVSTFYVLSKDVAIEFQIIIEKFTKFFDLKYPDLIYYLFNNEDNVNLRFNYSNSPCGMHNNLFEEKKDEN